MGGAKGAEKGGRGCEDEGVEAGGEGEVRGAVEGGLAFVADLGAGVEEGEEEGGGGGDYC